MITKEKITEFIKWHKEHYKEDDNPIFEIDMVRTPAQKEKLSGLDYYNKTVGFYYNIDDAIRCLNENWGDIREYTFDAAFILCRFPGIYNLVTTDSRMYFVWDDDKDGFFQQEEPDVLLNIGF